MMTLKVELLGLVLDTGTLIWLKKGWGACVEPWLVPLNYCGLVGTIIGGRNNGTCGVVEAGLVDTN